MKAERLQVFRSSGSRRQWYWRKLARNSRVCAVGGEGFVSMSHAKRAGLRQFPGLMVDVLGQRSFPVPQRPKAALALTPAPSCEGPYGHSDL